MSMTKDGIEAGAEKAADAVGVTPYSDMRPFVVQAVKWALSTLPIAGEGKVKPLEWRSGYRDSQVKIQQASSERLYQVRELDGVVWLDVGNEQTIYPSVDAAKAAAQTDYETRILSALISSPGKDGGQEVEAVDVEGSPLLEWAVDQWKSQVKHRPLVNVHRRSLDDVWRQVIRWAGGDPDKLVGPPHDALLAMESKR